MAVLSNTGIRAGASAAGGGGYQIEKSLRFNEPDSAKLSRTFTAAGDQTKFTLSFWFKNCDAGATNSKMVFCLDNGGSSQLDLYDGYLTTQFYDTTGSGWWVSANTSTTHRFRDPAAWYHIVLSIDTTAGTTNADRQKIYINGEQLTLTFSTAWGGLMTGKVKGWNTAAEHFIGMRGSSYGGNWMAAEYYFIDGQALDASSFGETDETTGQWVAKKYTGDYNYAEKLNLKGTTNNEALDVVVNRVVDKCWIKSDGNWVGGGNPSDTGSAPTFHILNGEAAANLYWATTAYDEAHTVTIGTSSETGTQPQWADSSGSWSTTTTVASGTFSSSYGHARTGAMTDGNVYAFTYTIDAPTGGSSGANHSGWFITDSVISSYASSVPDEQTSINSVGSRWYAASGDGGYAMDHIAVYGDFLALNTTGDDGSYTFLGGTGTNSFYLKFNGTDLGEDSSGINNDWTATNLTAGGSTFDVPCVRFDWVNSDNALSVPDHADLSFGGDDFTVECWIRPETPSGNTYHSIAGSSQTNYASSSWWFTLYSKTDGTSQVMFYFFRGSSGNYVNTGYVLSHDKWYHIVGTRDGDDLRIYVDGVHQASIDVSSYADMNDPSSPVTIGSDGDGNNDLKGAISNLRVVKGTCLYTNGTTFTVPSRPLENVTNTKLLCCQSSSSTTTAAVIPSGSITATGAPVATTLSDDESDSDQLKDTPTDFDDGGNGTGNYATWNPLRSLSTFTQGNLAVTSHSSGTYNTTATTLGMTSGKWYCEMTPSATGGTNNAYGIMNDTTNTNTYLGVTTGTDSSMGLWDNGGTYRNGAYTNASYCSAFQNGGETIGIALDVDNGTLKFYIDGVDKGNAWTDIPAGTWHFCVTTYQTTTTHITLNCGQRAFKYTPPTGYKALNTYNLPDPVITDPSKYFGTTLYNGSGSSNAITGVGFSPDLTWVKRRNQSTQHFITDIIRGAGDQLDSSATSAEALETARFASFDSDGFTVGSTHETTNESGGTYVAWNWDAGSSNTSVSADSISSTLYDQSKVWSDESLSSTGSVWSEPTSAAQLDGEFIFDGDTTTYVGPYSSGTLTVPFGQTFSGTKTFSVLWQPWVDGETIEDQAGNTLYTSSIIGSSTLAWVEFSGTDVSGLKFTAGSSANASRVGGIKVAGKWLLDEINTDQTWSTYGSFSGSWSGNYDWQGVFSDITIYNGDGSLYPTAATTWTLTSSIACSSEVKFYTYGATTVVINEGAGDETTISSSGGAYHFKSGSFSGDIDTIKVSTTGVYFVRLYIDGKALIDTGLGLTPATGPVPSAASTYRVNPDAGFSIVKYTGPSGTNDQTVAHGLNAKPAFMIIKNRDSSWNWDIYHKDLGYNASLIFTSATTRSGAFWDEPDSNIFHTKSGYTTYAAEDYVAYCWSEVAGYSKFGTYIGNADVDGPMVWCGFKPAFVMIKKHDSTDNWLIWDNARGPYNENTKKLAANIADEENSGNLGNDSYNMVDFVSNGFKIRSSASSANGASNFIFAAFAELPFKYSNAH